MNIEIVMPDPSAFIGFIITFAIALPICAIIALGILGRNQDHGKV